MVDRANRDGDGLDALLGFLKRTRGFDFTGYKRTSLERRIRKRMDEIDVPDYARYLDLLEVQPEEYADLFNTILINVTDFFRDKPAWDNLAGEVLPKLLEELPDDQPIRVWCAGCASGQEPYTTAVVLAQLLGDDQFRERVKIYATDVDAEALNQARLSQYTNDEVKHVPGELLEQYFERTDHGYTVRADLRRAAIFGRNDLVQDAPISRVDLLVCRNTLMYFNAETQSRILGRFNFALRPTGVLFLGKSEMLITHADLFTPISLKWRVFRRVPQDALRERIGMLRPGGGHEEEAPERYLRLRDGATDIGKGALLVLDRSGFVVSANQEARALFGLNPHDIGRPLQDLEVSYRPVELRSLLEQAYQEQRAVHATGVEFGSPGSEQLTLDVTVAPVTATDGAVLGASVAFEDVTPQLRMKAELERAKRELETAYEELQSTVEELETTNEELQSTNEELETTNEELQSTNEELETMNDELRERTIEVDRVNTVLEAILSSLRLGVAVIDSEQRVQLWNPAAEDMWGLRRDEVEGEQFLDLDIGLPVGKLREPLKSALAGEPQNGAVSLEAVNRRGRHIISEVSSTPLLAADGSVYGAILLMSERDAGGS